MDGPPASSDFWAKLKYKDGDRSTGEIVAWHPLLAHSADVAAFDGGFTIRFADRTFRYDRFGLALDSR